jgi:hypothetical protein
MKSKLSILAVLLTTMLVMPAFAVIPSPPILTPGEPHDRNAMWVEYGLYALDTVAAGVGDKFNITVSMNITQDVFFYQIGLLYNRIWLKCTRAGYTAGTTSMYFLGHATTEAGNPPIIDTSFLGNGSVLVSGGCTGTDNVTGPHSGTLIWAEMQIMIGPNKGENFTGKFDISTKYSATTWVKDPGLVKIALTPYDSDIWYAWAPPTTKPFMGIEHDNGFGPFLPSPTPANTWPLVWSQYAPGLGVRANMTSGFSALIYVKNIDPAWYMQNVTFTLSWNSTVIDVLGGLGNVTVDGAWTVVSSTIGAGSLTLALTGFTGSVPPLSNKVLVATVKFTVMIQGLVPPLPAGYFDKSLLTFSSVLVQDHLLDIATAAPQQGEVDIYALLTLQLPYLYVDPATTIIGPAPSIGSTFSITIKVANMTTNWHCVAIQTRLTYDDLLFSLVSVTEGPFMTDTTWDMFGTFWYTLNEIGGDPMFPITHVMILDLLYPNHTTGIYDQTVFPNTVENSDVDPTFATLTFQVLSQNCFGMPNITSAFNILPFWKPSDKTFIDRDANYIASLPGINGTVIIAALNFVGRQIDLYGGAINDGYGVLVGSPYLQFPAPYGGQGPNHYMDIVFPQSWVYLNANVTYNYWPVQSKDVGFEIEGPYEHITNQTGDFYVPLQRYQVWAKFTATTDSNGVASYAYRMPWPCDDPDGITGVWKITSTVTIADEVVMDTMLFYYERLVVITSVTTDSYGYYHDQCVKVTVNYKTHSVEYYPALFAVVITDELGVPFGMQLHNTEVGGATFCTWKPGTFTVTICIPKWAYAGNGYVHVSVYDKDPTIGGEPLAPEFKPYPQINIYPY